MHLEHRSRKIRCAKISTSDSAEKNLSQGNFSGYVGCKDCTGYWNTEIAVKSLHIRVSTNYAGAQERWREMA